MKNHVAFKFIAILLCTLTLLTALLSIAAVVVLEQQELYEVDLEQELEMQKTEVLSNIASDIAVRYASDYLGGCDVSVIQSYYGSNYVFAYYLKDESIAWNILDETGKLLYKSPRSGTGWTTTEVPVTWGSYLRMVEPGTPTEIPAVESTNPTGDPEDSESDSYFFPDPESGVYVEYELVHEDMPAWKVVLYLQPDAWKDAFLFEAILLVWQNRYNLFWIIGVSLLLFAIGAVYLCCAAGKRPGSEEIQPGGFNALPLDLYAVLSFLFVAFCFWICVEVYRWYDTGVFVTLMCFLFVAFACCLVFVAFCFACAAQFKVPGYYWLRHSVVGFTVLTMGKAIHGTLGWLKEHVPSGTAKICGWIVRLVTGFFSGLWKITQKLWRYGVAAARWLWKHFCAASAWLWQVLCRGVRWCFGKLHRFYSLLPLTWQWLLTGFVLVLMLYICLRSYRTGWILMGFGIFFAVILYGAGAFGILMEATRRMGKGDLETKVSDQFLLGAFRDFAGDLNALADVAKEAARKEMKSERMKSELITNVSHDIKTPLTSIINYVDLLQKPHTPEEEQQYLEVLGRKSEQLKKLIQDLMEMSKASTGNMAVYLEQVDAVETVTQALGEFADKLAERRLTAVFTPPEGKVLMQADGRLAWRVLNNLLNNAVKYALPGTRLYVDLAVKQGRILISLKNVSAEPLNVDAEELMERFVRGDAARNSDGSGLGLNIAKSLMEVQGGSLTLTVDGDLFKATLSFPGVYDKM